MTRTEARHNPRAANARSAPNRRGRAEGRRALTLRPPLPQAGEGEARRGVPRRRRPLSLQRSPSRRRRQPIAAEPTIPLHPSLRREASCPCCCGFSRRCTSDDSRSVKIPVPTVREGGLRAVPAAVSTALDLRRVRPNNAIDPPDRTNASPASNPKAAARPRTSPAPTSTAERRHHPSIQPDPDRDPAPPGASPPGRGRSPCVSPPAPGSACRPARARGWARAHGRGRAASRVPRRGGRTRPSTRGSRP